MPIILLHVLSGPFSCSYVEMCDPKVVPADKQVAAAGSRVFGKQAIQNGGHFHHAVVLT